MSDIKLFQTDGQLKIVMEKAVSEKFTLKDSGLKTEFYEVESGNLRLKIELGAIEDHNFYKMPIIEINYKNNIHESEWVVEFNGENILETKGHSGHSTVLLLNRKKMDGLKQRHENSLIIHGDFSEIVNLKEDSSFRILAN